MNNDFGMNGVDINRADVNALGQAGRTASIVEPRKSATVAMEKKTWYWWVIGLLAVMIVALAGVLIWKLIDSPEGVKDPSAEAMQEIAELKAEIQHDKDAREMVGILQGVVEERLKQVTDSAYIPAVIWKVYDSVTPSYQPEGVLVKMPLERAYAFRIESVDDEALRAVLMGDELADKLTGVLEGRGYKLYADTMGTQDYLNEQTGIICGLSMHSVPFVVSCGYVGWVNQDAEQMGLLNELAEAYRKTQGDYPAWLVTSTQNIKNSSQVPYQTLQASLEGGVGLFYRKDESSPWQFFAGAQAVLDCGYYETEEERKAFADEVCYDEATGQNMTVGDLLYVE